MLSLAWPTSRPRFHPTLLNNQTAFHLNWDGQQFGPPPTLLTNIHLTISLIKPVRRGSLGVDHPYDHVERLFSPADWSLKQFGIKVVQCEYPAQSHFSLAPPTDQACDMEGKVIVRRRRRRNVICELTPGGSYCRLEEAELQ